MLHPIKALNQIIEEYKDFLLTEFRAKDPQLKQALERELERPGFLAQEPFYQAHRPLKEGKRWQDLPIDKKLAKVMEERSGNEFCYGHQSESIEHLLGNNATPLVVTTGTGSGKTECFLLPVIQNAIEDSISFKKPGLTAVLLYPMNALANDQLERIKDYLESSCYSSFVKVAKYDRGTTQSEREKLRKKPPHNEEDTIDIPEEDLFSHVSKRKSARTMKGKNILTGSLDINSLRFSSNPEEYSLKVLLAPARNRCLCCGMTAGR